MKKTITLLLCISLLSSCASDNAKETVVASETETASTVSETSITEAITHLSEKTAYISEEPSEELVLTPIKSGDATDVLECEIIENFCVYDESEFPDKEQLEHIRKAVFIDEKIQTELAEYAELIENNELEYTLITSADELAFIKGGTYDFDMDGEEECIICLSYAPDNPMMGGIWVYSDGVDTEILFSSAGPYGEATVLDFGSFCYLQLLSHSGGLAFFTDIYSFENGIEKALGGTNLNRGIIYENGIFKCMYEEYDSYYPVVCCPDKKLRQLAVEEITETEFAEHVHNGGEYLEHLKADGTNIDKIYTCGYKTYRLCGDDFEKFIEITENGAEARGGDPLFNTMALTDELLYNCDLWNLNTVTAEESLVLTPNKSDETLNVLGCNIISDFWTQDEAEFLNRTHLQTAKELCYSDEEIFSEIERYNEANNLPISITVNSAADIRFNGGGTYDFDMDGKEESLLCLNYSPAWAMGGYTFVYVDEENSCILIDECGGSASAAIMDFGEFIYVKVNYFAGVSSYFADIYSFENGIHKKFDGSKQSCNITYENGLFKCYVKYAFGYFPFVCCTDGEFRQLGIEKISRESFEQHVENGDKYIKKLASQGKEVTEIYTCGYYAYWLFGAGFEERITFDENGTFTVDESKAINCPDFAYKEIYLTDNILYGKDVWNLNIVPQTDTEPVLKPIAGDKTTDVLGCSVISLDVIKDESTFPYPEQLKAAREICFSDKTIRERIDKYNTPEAVETIPQEPIEQPEDIELTAAYCHDFDSDGEDESVFYLNFTPQWVFNTGGCVYVDGDEATILEKEINAYGEAEVLIFKDFSYMKLSAGVGVSTLWQSVYRLINSTPERCGGVDSYEDGLFFDYYNAVLGFTPYICTPDGVFRQLGIEEISLSDFAEQVENGGRYLRRLKADGQEVTKIYTCGRYIYWLCGEGFETSFFLNKDGAEPNSNVSRENYNPTDETIYGVDIWNLNIIS